MFGTVRHYAGLREATIAAAGERAADIAAVLASVPGSGDAYLIRTRDGLILVTVGSDEPSLVESGRRFRAWVDDEIRDFGAAGEAQVWSGSVLLRQVVTMDTVAVRPPERSTR